MKKYRLTAWILICVLLLGGCGMIEKQKDSHEPRIFGATYMTRNNPYFDVLHEAIQEIMGESSLNDVEVRKSVDKDTHLKQEIPEGGI